MMQRGFTLVELLVAIAIFAILSTMGWKVFNHVMDIRDRNVQHEQQLSALQSAHQQLLRDTLQIAPLEGSVRDNKRPALVLQDGVFHFSKIGVSDPLGQGYPPTERIEYRYRADEQKLYRLRYRYLHSDGRDQPDSSVLLEQVEDFKIMVLNPDIQTRWPDDQQDVIQNPAALKYLPQGLRVELTVQGATYVWIYSLLDTEFLTQNTEQK